MARLFFLVVMAMGAASAGCSANTATQERQPNPPAQIAAAPAPAPVVATVPESPADQGIRRDLTLAIARDTDLHRREITFVITNGDVSVTGIVQTEEERRKINELAMNIDGVRSVANALRVAE